MMQDRNQKQSALRLSVSNRWFPQLEVDVNPGMEVSSKDLSVTDLDVLASVPDQFEGFRSIVFDCKTRSRESPVNRALWLAGVLEKVDAEQGFCILKKDAIEPDHALMASRLKVILLSEKDFDLYAKTTSRRYGQSTGNIGNIDLWDVLFSVGSRYPGIAKPLEFLRTTFWMTEDQGEASRKTVAMLRRSSPELDPANPEHVAIFFEFCALFAHSLAVVICRLFKVFLQPSNPKFLSDALAMTLYGGRDNYRYRSEVNKLIKGISNENDYPDLTLPEWDRLLQLVRQLLDAPFEIQQTPLILREVGFSVLCGDPNKSFAKELCAETPQGARFAVLVSSYLAKAAKLPPDFNSMTDEILLPLLPVP